MEQGNQSAGGACQKLARNDEAIRELEVSRWLFTDPNAGASLVLMP
jgi:hypothetical protein